MRRVELTPLIAAASAGFAAWVSMGSLAVIGEGVPTRVGFLPPLWLLPALMFGAALAGWACRLSKSTSLPLFFSLVLLLPWVPMSTPPAFLIWSGPVEIGVWIAIAVAMLLARHPVPFFSASGPIRSGPRIAAALAFVAYLIGASSLASRMPSGDEPHYLVITQSILHDGDIRVENNYAQGQYLQYFPGSLRPHGGRRSVHGEMYSIHAPGLAVVVAPAFALAGYPGVVVFLSLVAAAGSALLWRQAYALTGSASAAWFAWATGALGATFFFEAFAVYPDGPGGTLVLFAALPLFERETSTRRWTAVGAALGLLPWLHTRFAVISCVLGLVLLLRLLRSAKGRAQIAPFLVFPVISAVAWFSFFRVVYGSFNPSSPYGGNTQTSASNILRGLPALFLDQQFGMLPNAPVYAFCLAGLVMLAFRKRRLALELCAVGIGYLAAVSSFQMWFAGDSAPARFLAPMVPLFSIPAAFLWSSSSMRATRSVAVAALTASLLATAMMVMVDGGRLAHNTSDGYARAAEWMSPLTDLPLALPSFFRHTPGDAVLRAGVWSAFLFAAVAVLRTLERKTDVRGVLELATPASLALAVMGAASTVWAIDAAPAVNSENSLTALSGYSAWLRPTGLDLEARTIAPADSLLPKLVVSTPRRRGVPSEQTLLLAPTPVRAGEYEVRLENGARAEGRAKLVIGRQARPIRTWDIGADLRSRTAVIRLPVTVGSLVVLGDGRASAGTVTLIPRRIWEGSSRLTSDIARRVEPYGPAQVFFFGAYDNYVFLEDPGFWVKGGERVQLAVTSDDLHAPLRMFVRNAAAINHVRIEIDGDVRSFDLHPREELTMAVPILDPRPGALIRIDSVSGFTPSEVEPGSTDERFLGVWVEFR